MYRILPYQKKETLSSHFYAASVPVKKENCSRIHHLIRRTSNFDPVPACLRYRTVPLVREALHPDPKPRAVAHDFQSLVLELTVEPIKRGALPIFLQLRDGKSCQNRSCEKK